MIWYEPVWHFLMPLIISWWVILNSVPGQSSVTSTAAFEWVWITAPASVHEKRKLQITFSFHWELFGWIIFIFWACSLWEKNRNFSKKKNIEALRDTESKKLVNASRQKKKQFKVLPPLFPNLWFECPSITENRGCYVLCSPTQLYRLKTSSVLCHWFVLAKH